MDKLNAFPIKEIQWVFKPFEALLIKELEAVFQLRQEVFIIEQDCPYPDIDGKDDQAIHLMGWYEGKLVATLRIFPSYQPYENHCSLGRVCTSFAMRTFGIGKLLMAEAVQYIDVHFSEKKTQIGAQHYLKAFYEGFGFSQCSEPYDEDGIEHIMMIRQNLKS